MNEWSVGTLPDFADLLSGCTVSAAQFGQGVKYITVQQLYYGNTIDVSSSPSVRISDFETERYKLIDGDILIGKSSVKLEGIGYPAWFKSVNEPVIFSNFTVRIRSKSIIDQSYLFYWLRSSFARKWIIAQAQQSALTNINQNIINRFPVYFPKNINSQKKIASILGSIDLAIEKTEVLIEKYQHIKAGLMHDLFTRGIDEDGKLRPSREQAPELYQETSIGWIPKDWDFMPFDDCIDLLTDYHANGAYEILKKHVELLDCPDFAVMIRTTNFEQNDFERDVKYISKDAFSFLSKSAVQPNDILMNKIANPGVTYLMPDLGVPVSLGMNLFLLRLKNSFSPAFIQAYLEFREDYVKSFSNGTGTKTITKDAVRSLIVVKPKKNDEVNRITDLLSKLNKKINIENEHLIRSKNIKDGLMHDLLTGKVPVRLNNVEADHV